MPRTKQATKRRRAAQAAVPALGAAGLTFSLAGGASAAVVPPTDGQLRGITPGQQVILGEEELSDVTLATFHVFDKENLGAKGDVQLTRCRCGGCRGCRGCGGCRCGGCGWGGGCCLSWGACRLC
jgi:hypothetical protein